MRSLKSIVWITSGLAVGGLAIAAAQAAARPGVVAATPVVTRLDPITVETVPAVTTVTAPVVAADPVAVVPLAVVRPNPIDPRSPARPAPIIIIPR